MSYILKVANKTPYSWQTSDGQSVATGAVWNPKTEPLGNGWIRSNQFGTINFLDIGDKHIPGDSGETWGVLISYQGEEMVGRYEGGGTLGVLINPYGEAEFSGNMDIRQVSLPAFIR